MFLKMLIRLLVVACALLLIAQLVPGIVIANFYTALVVAVLWGIISLTLKPLLTLLTLPINIFTLGIFSFVINALLFWLLATFISGFTISGFLPALLGSVLLSLVQWVLHKVF